MARGIEKRPIFRDDRDRDDFLRRLAGLSKEGAWVVYAWSLMPNHFHLLVRTAGLPLSRSMRRLLTGYAGAFNRRHRRSGHLFQNRYKSVVCEEEPYFLELVRYLHLNPVRAGVVGTLRELDRYPYSGHSAIVGRVRQEWQETAGVLGRFGGRRSQAAERYRAFVAEGISQGRRPDLMGGGLVRSLGGWQAVTELRRGREKHVSDERVLGTGAFVERILKEAEAGDLRRRSRVSLGELLSRIGRDLGVSADAISAGSRNRPVSRARAVLAYVWTEVLGRSGRELARSLGVSPVSVYLAARRARESMEAWDSRIKAWCK
jgi:REP element-mobilizing transposase RayT